MNGELAKKKAIVKAKSFSNPENRDWLEVGRALMYGEPSNEVAVFVLEGTPPMGFILAYGTNVNRLDGNGKVLKRFYTYE